MAHDGASRAAARYVAHARCQSPEVHPQGKAEVLSQLRALAADWCPIKKSRLNQPRSFREAFNPL